MSAGIRVALALGLIAFSQGAFAADDSSSLCRDVSASKALVAAHHGRWIDLSPDQWQFLRGVFVVNPETPAGLPFGDRAALARFEGYVGGIVFFIDGDKACTPMAAPPELVSLMQDVATKTINHWWTGL